MLRLALAARLVGTHAVILMPEDAPAAKLAATRGYGAEVVTYDRYTGDRVAIGGELAAERETFERRRRIEAGQPQRVDEKVLDLPLAAPAAGFRQ